MQQRDGDVVPITHIRDIQSFGFAEFLLNRERIRHALAGMVVITQTIDHGNLRPFRQFKNMSMLKRTCHNCMHITRHNARNIRNGFALAETDLIRRKIQRIAAAMPHRHIERDACSKTRLLEDHPKHLAFEQRRVAFLEIFFFELECQV